MALLGVNIDHVATLRQQRCERDPDPVAAALCCQRSGADSIVAHLREDRRHIQDADIVRLARELTIPFNLEMSVAPDVVARALKVRPAQVTVVPERRRELTTEGGLNVVAGIRRIREVASRFADRGTVVSLFIAPDRRQIDAALRAGIRMIELHTGHYALLDGKKAQQGARHQLEMMTAYACSLGMTVNAGHGLKYHNTAPVASIPGMHELNIGHSIVARAVFSGLEAAVRDMKRLVRGTGSVRKAGQERP